MSATVTDNPVSTALHRATQPAHLQDYEVRLTSGDAPAPAPPNADNPRAPVANPPGWADQHRGVPPYRPINRNLDRSQRPLGGSPVGTAFVTTMFTGVSIMSVSCPWLTEKKVWGRGPLFDQNARLIFPWKYLRP